MPEPQQLEEVVANWLEERLILQQFTHENCPPEKDVTTCIKDADGKHRPCMECHIEYVKEETRSLCVELYLGLPRLRRR